MNVAFMFNVLCVVIKFIYRHYHDKFTVSMKYIITLFIKPYN